MDLGCGRAKPREQTWTGEFLVRVPPSLRCHLFVVVRVTCAPINGKKHCIEFSFSTWCSAFLFRRGSSGAPRRRSLVGASPPQARAPPLLTSQGGRTASRHWFEKELLGLNLIIPIRPKRFELLDHHTTVHITCVSLAVGKFIKRP